MASEQDLIYCVDLLRREDRDRYLACLFAPAGRCRDLIVLHAFNLELARATDVGTEPLLSEMRLQWWRDALPAIFAGKPPRQPTASALSELLARVELDRGQLGALVEARSADLSEEPPRDLAALERYGEETAGRLALLGLELLDVRDEASREAARALAVAWALTGLLRAIPYHATQRRSYLPADLSQAAGLDLEALFALRSGDALRQIARRLAEEAGRHLARYRVLRHQASKAARPLLLPAVLCRLYLRKLAAADYDPFAPAVQAPNPGNVWRLAWAAASGRY